MSMDVDHEARAQDAHREAEAAEGRAGAARKRARNARDEIAGSPHPEIHALEAEPHERAAARHDAGAELQRDHAREERSY
jgi:hypothetical protein